MSENDKKPIEAHLEYPRSPNKPDAIEISLWDVRAADNITIKYDFDRDGWTVHMDRRDQLDDIHLSEIVEPLAEVAFIPAWLGPKERRVVDVCTFCHRELKIGQRVQTNHMLVAILTGRGMQHKLGDFEYQHSNCSEADGPRYDDSGNEIKDPNA